MSVMISNVGMYEHNSECIPGIVKITYTTGVEVTYHRTHEGRRSISSGSTEKLTNFNKPNYDQVEKRNDVWSFEALEVKWRAQLLDIEMKFKSAFLEAERLFRQEKAEIEANCKFRINALNQFWSKMSKEMLDDCRQSKRQVGSKINGLQNPESRLRLLVKWMREVKLDEMRQAANLLESESDYIINESTTHGHWDAFLSHVNMETSYACRNIKDSLSRKDIFLWYDKTVGRSDNRGMIDGVRASALFLIVLSKHYFLRSYCLFEYCVAAILGKPIITIVETDPKHGGGPISSFQFPPMFKHIKNHDFIEISQTYWDSFITKLHWRMMKTMKKDHIKGILEDEEHCWLVRQLREGGWRFGKCLFASYIDGNSLKSFHDKCDDLGATITVIEAETGLVFGGFNPVSWTSTKHEYIKLLTTWLFCLRDGPYRRINIKPGKSDYAVNNNPMSGPCFGISDLHVRYGQNSFCSCWKSSYKAGIFSENGQTKFQIGKWEVFQCVKIQH